MASAENVLASEPISEAPAGNDDVFTMSQTPPPIVDKPLPPPPQEAPEEKSMASSNWRAAALPAPVAESEATLPPLPAPSPAPVAPRLKTKVPWGKKNISILLPLDDQRGQRGKAPKPMTENDVIAMLRDWEQLGYNVHGFNLEFLDSDDAAKQGQSRPMWPGVKEVQEERQSKNFKVSIPDRRQWDAYVQELKEAKLRALGVSMGDEDPLPTPSPAPTLSRQASAQYPGLPFSPPIPTASAASSHGGSQHPKLFSPPLLSGVGPPTGSSSFVGSTSSPASIHAQMLGKFHAQRQSVSFIGGDHPFGSFPSSQAQSPVLWSPQHQQMLQQGGMHRHGSPSLYNLGSIMSPTSPFSQDGYFPNDMQIQNRQRSFSGQLPFQPHLQHPISRQSPLLQEVPQKAHSPEKSPSKTPEASQFMQSNHRQNMSDSLQKEIEDAEYHLEKQFQKQLEHDDYSPHSEKSDVPPLPKVQSHIRNQSTFAGPASRYADDQDGPVLQHPQPHSRGHSLSQRPFDVSETASPALEGFASSGASAKLELSEIETNPSNFGTPKLGIDTVHERSLSTSTNPWLDSEPVSAVESSKNTRFSHGSKPSVSKLNVAAPEFKFNPGKTFIPGQQFGFGSTSQQLPISVFNAAPPSNVVPPPVTFGSSAFGSSTFGNSKIKPDAPAFIPGQKDFNFSSSKPAFRSSEIKPDAPAFIPGQKDFSFSSSGPTFRPDAPAFKPLNAQVADSVGSEAESSPNFGSSIFGKIDMSLMDIVKPPKKSKAIPIVRPDSSSGAGKSPTADDSFEGLDGRITQGEGRIKRAKGAADDGDSVPLFAEPTPLQETTREQSPPKNESPFKPSQADKENSPMVPEPEPENLRIETNPTVKNLQSQPTNRFDDSPDYEGKGWAPFEWQQQKEAEAFSYAMPHPVRDAAPFKVYEQSLPSDGAVTPSSSTTNGPKKHKKNSLSALAKPFEIGSAWFGLGNKEPAAETPVSPVTPVSPGADTPVVEAVAEVLRTPPVPTPISAPIPVPPRAANRGLAASRYARIPTPPAKEESPAATLVAELEESEEPSFQEEEEVPRSPSPQPFGDTLAVQASPRGASPSFEEIDAIMHHMNQTENDLGHRNALVTPQWEHGSATGSLQIPNEESSPLRLQQPLMRSDAPSPSPRRFQPLPGDRVGQRVFGRVQDDPFVGHSPVNLPFESSPIHHLNGNESVEPSDWDDVLSPGDEAKFNARAQFFDNHVNDLVGGLLAERLDPLERVLGIIQQSLKSMQRTPSSRRDRRSLSAELPESDADDEDDDEDVHQRSLSPRKDRKMDKIRSIVADALSQHLPALQAQPKAVENPSDPAVLQALEDLREQFGQSMHLDFRGEDLRNIVEDAVERRMPPSPKPAIDELAQSKITDLEARVAELNDRLKASEAKADDEVKGRRAAETRVEELYEKLKLSDEKAEQQIADRRAAEDRLAENQRLLRISSEEETRLRETLEEREKRVKDLEESRSKVNMRTSLLEASSGNAQKNQTELLNRVAILETQLREARQTSFQWQFESEKANEAAKSSKDEAEKAIAQFNNLRRAQETIRIQMEESLRTRETFRGKLGALQNEMARAAQEVSQENAHRAKKEQALIARQEVLDARLQAEARTRERLEREIERLEAGEREGIRAVNDSKKLDALVLSLKAELEDAQKAVLRHKREFEEARESGLSEVQRTRNYMQAEIEAANNQVNIVRQDLEDQAARVRAELDNLRLDYDTARERHDMLLEEATESRDKELKEVIRRHKDELDDIHTQHERQLGNAVEDAQRAEQHLLERLSLSGAKTEHLQDRVTHLEEKLEVSKSAALAAAEAARKSGEEAKNATEDAKKSIEEARKNAEEAAAKRIEEVVREKVELSRKTSVSRPILAPSALPEKISPQALRESIMVLQEQLQNREQMIEELEHQLSQVDLEAPTKISKRDDEIVWLRELLAVRLGDLQDIINTIDQEDFEPEHVKAAAIRLKANLQMEEQERERALNGGSAINLPNIANSIREAASPRVAQVVGPMAAAWGNWRKNREAQSESRSGTPSKNSPSTQSAQGFLSGLLTPPAPARQTPPQQAAQQPSAFNSTGRRLTSSQIAAAAANSTMSRASPRKGKAVATGPPATPPMMRKSSYDADARQEDFSDAGFYDDDESTVDEGLFGANLGR